MIMIFEQINKLLNILKLLKEYKSCVKYVGGLLWYH